MGKLKSARLWLAILVGMLVVSGCASGGGGGGGNVAAPLAPASPPPPPPPPSAFPSSSSSEFRANWGVNAISATTAWQKGATGAGIKIGVIDDGVVDSSDPAYSELQGRIDPASRDIVAGRNQLSSTQTHGSELAAIISGNFNDQRTVGVAYGATILAVRADNGSGTFNDNDLAAALNYAVSQGVKVVNFSLGKATPVSAAFETALRAATAAGVIVVVSAGNCGPGNASCSPSETEVNYPGFYANTPSVSNGLIMVAGGMNQGASGYGTYNNVSNPAGVNQNWYLTAPGWGIIVPDFGPAGPVPGFQSCGAAAGIAEGLCQIQGTSYASPHVAGAAALLMQAFPGLTPAQVVNLLLTSTDDIGAPGIDAVTGRGALNLAKAFAPSGAISVPLGAAYQSYAGNQIGIVGAAFGNAFQNGAAWTVAGFDSYNRTFAVSLAPSWRSAGLADRARDPAPLLWQSGVSANGVSTSFALAETAPPDSARVIGELPQTAFRSEVALGGGLRVAFARGVAAAQDASPAPVQGHMAFAGYDSGASFTQDLNAHARLSVTTQNGAFALGHGYGQSERRGAQTRLDYQRGRASFGAAIGAVVEDGSVLGTTWTGLMAAAPHATTRFAGLSGSFRLAPGVEAGVETEIGATSTSGASWLSTQSDLITSASAASMQFAVMPAALRAWLPGSAGHLTLAISQPLRVESGAFGAMLPTADAWGRQSLAFEQRAIPASPTGRELDASITYSFWADEQLMARISAIYANEPGHDRDAPPEQAVTLGMRYAF